MVGYLKIAVYGIMEQINWDTKLKYEEGMKPLKIRCKCRSTDDEEKEWCPMTSAVIGTTQVDLVLTKTEKKKLCVMHVSPSSHMRTIYFGLIMLACCIGYT